jgi:DCN1-like protein 1/2
MVITHHQRNQKNDKPIQTIFDKYKDVESNDAIRDDGSTQFLTDCGMGEPDDIVSFVFAWQCDCKTFGEFTLVELEHGFKKLKYNSAEEISKNVQNIRNIVNTDSKFKEMYTWIFNYVKDPTKRYIENEMATVLWQILLKNKFEFLDKWCKWITEEYKLAITRDTWLMIYDFADQKITIDTYDPNDSWPIIIDRFIEFLKTQ